MKFLKLLTIAALMLFGVASAHAEVTSVLGRLSLSRGQRITEARNRISVIGRHMSYADCILSRVSSSD
jgi:hypothetical protein